VDKINLCGQETKAISININLETSKAMGDASTATQKLECIAKSKLANR
jgi:hypothetical protein